MNKMYTPVRYCYSRAINFWRRFPDYSVMVLVMFVLTFGIILPYLCSKMIYSTYFSPETDNDGLIKKVTDLNNKRLTYAENYISRLLIPENKQHYLRMMDQDDNDLAIGVVTMKRQVRGDLRLGYLTQVMAKLDKVIKNDHMFPRKVLFLCEVYPGPGNHTEARELSHYFPIYTRFPEGSPADTIKDPFDKEKEDYIYCLQRALNHRPKYIIIIEDDAIPYDHIFKSLQKIFGGESDSYLSTTSGMYVEPWAYLKLFYPERWQGYSLDNGISIIELLSIACIGGILSIALFYCHLAKKGYRHVYSGDEGVVFCLGSVYLATLAVTVGRQYWLLFLHHINQHHLVPAPDCCSPAILYKTPMAQELITFLASTTCNNNYPLDLAMARFAADNQYPVLLVEPNLVKHIGMVSSLKSTIRFPQDFIY